MIFNRTLHINYRKCNFLKCTLKHQCIQVLQRNRTIKRYISIYLYHSDQISRSVMSDSLRPHGLQPTRLLPVQHQLPEFTQSHIHGVCDAIQPSHSLSSPSPLAPNYLHSNNIFISLYEAKSKNKTNSIFLNFNFTA